MFHLVEKPIDLTYLMDLVRTLQTCGSASALSPDDLEKLTPDRSTFLFSPGR